VETRRVPALLIAFAACHGGGPNQDALGREANQALVEYRRVITADAPTFSDSLISLTSHLVTGSSEAGAILQQRVMPPLDRAIGAIDHAISASDAYVATGVKIDTSTKTSLETLRRRSKALHQLHDTLVKVHVPLTAEQGEALQSAIASAGWAMVL